ncbi:MAG TPA: hypothetical protein VNA15_05135 [Candidatus Angelobacter sp.]|nr:hypothetical protein [Candidatus Angelobacter sp.]
MDDGRQPERVIIRALPMLVPESIVQQDAEKNRVKRGILGGSEERFVFGKTLYLPYLDFTYQYIDTRGFLSKQSVLGRGRSVFMALREVNLGFYPEMISLLPQLAEIEPDTGSVVQGVDSTVLVRERFNELKRMLSDYDDQLRELSKQYGSLTKTDRAKQEIKENIDHLKNTRETRWKMFADGLKLPSKIDLEKFELLEGNIFYMPYFIARFSRSGESRYMVWNREGKENDTIAEELMKNSKLRDLVQSYVRG